MTASGSANWKRDHDFHARVMEIFTPPKGVPLSDLESVLLGAKVPRDEAAMLAKAVQEALEPGILNHRSARTKERIKALAQVRLAEQRAKSWGSPFRFVRIVLNKKHRTALDLSLSDLRDELKEMVIAGQLTPTQARRRYHMRAAVEVAHVVGPFVIWCADAALKVLSLTESLKHRTPPNS